jgi:NhaD family Na+/H+ antiporter
MIKFIVSIAITLFPVMAQATIDTSQLIDLTDHFVGYFAIALFIFALFMVIIEEHIHLRKSKPVMLAAGLIWAAIAIMYMDHENQHIVEEAARHNLLEYAELMLFLLVAMTYVNSMTERRVFDALHQWLIKQGFGFKKLFWLTGILSFLMSPVADNLTTALVMCTIIISVGGNNTRFINLSCINIVVASNAGGAFSPFGDITTLMVWQKGLIDFWTFFNLFLPSVVNFLVPAIIMSFFVTNERPEINSTDGDVSMLVGAKRIIALFLVTIATAVTFHSVLHLPPVFGMLTGFSFLQLFGYYLKMKGSHMRENRISQNPEICENTPDDKRFDIFKKVEQTEWDTLFFFYGVVMCVGGLGFIGYLAVISESLYSQWDPTWANSAVGVLSAIVDNIPVMFAVLSMNPDMSTGQWLLVTLTAGVGGSLLSIGSAAGVAVMGQARGSYTFFSHLKWTPVIALGYVASIATHLALNSDMF